MSTYELADRVAVVTGGAKGIGFAIAEKLETCGASVRLWDSRPEVLPREALAGRRMQIREVDVTDTRAVDAACASVLAEAGRIDILVNNAGLTGPTVPLEEYDPDTWRHVVEVNLFGVYHCCRVIVPHMRAAGYGRVVNIASLAGKEGTPYISPYSAAKAAVISLTKSLGKELATSGVLVNCVAPAAVETDILEQMSPEFVAAMVAKSPMQRLGRVDEVAELVAWLCSEACSFNTGAAFDLSGGRATY